MNRQDAVSIATRFLAERIGPDLTHPAVGKLVVQEDLAREHESAWAVPFNSVAFVATGDLDMACVNSVIIVPKADSPAFLPPTDVPVEDFLAETGSQSESGQPWLQ